MSEEQSTIARKSTLPRATIERQVLERQLALFSTPKRVTIFGLPVWATIVSWLLTGAYPVIGQVPASVGAAWVGTIIATCAVGFLVDNAYRREREKVETFDPHAWLPRVIGVMTLQSAAWASLIWLFWDPVNQTNQLTLIVFVLFGVMNGMVARINHFAAYLAGAGMSFGIMWLRCVTGDTDVAWIFTIALPMVFAVLSASVRTASGQIHSHISAQVENEYLKEENARARDEAERANRMKSNFLANMSHELRTPLNAVLGFSEIIASQSFGPDATEKYRDYASDIHTSGRHLLGLINSLLDIAKIEVGKLELQLDWVDAARELKEAARFVEEKASEKGVSVEVHAGPEASRVWCDERAFMQVALNLLSNAVKFTERGVIRAEIVRQADGHVLKVRDTGCGIPAHQISRVFEAFEQVDNRYTKSNTGTGLGLTLVRALVTLHGGTCSVSSTDGVGTEVTLTFPAPEPPRAAAPAGLQARVA